MSKKQYVKQFNNSILGGNANSTGLDTEWLGWNNQSGENVLGFIKNKLEGAVTDIEFRDLTIIGKNAFGTEVCETKVEIMQPLYGASLKVVGFRINDVECSSSGTYAYTENATYEVGIQLNVGYQTSAWTDMIRSSEKVTITVGKNYNIFEINTVTKENPETVWVDITSLIQKSSSDDLAAFNITVFANPTYLDNTGALIAIIENGLTKTTATYKVVKLEVTCSTKNLILSNNTIDFLVKGVKNNEYKLQYCCKTIQELQDIALNLGLSYDRNGIAINNTGLVSYKFDDPGVYCLFVRAVHNTNAEIASNWVQYNVIAAQGYVGDPLPIVTDIASTIQNCDTATLFNLTVHAANGGNTEIKSYLSDDSNTVWDYEFKSATYNNVLSTDKISLAFTTYNEFHNLSDAGALRYLGITLKIAGKSYILKNYTYYSASGTIRARDYFNFVITQPEGNKDGSYQYVDDSSLLKHFSQINLQNNDIFEADNLDPDLGSNDGYTINTNNTSFKVFAHYQNTSTGVFKTPINFKELLLSNQGFTFEVEYKTSNSNGEDPVFSLGSLIFGPGYCRLDTNDADKNSEVSFWKNSRASFSKDDSTHLLIVYIPLYIPSTYADSTYELLFPDYRSKTSLPYNLLRVYVNGTINREIRLDDPVKWLSGTKESSNPTFNFQIHPISSDVEFYTIRVYNRALSVGEVLKNRTSSLSKIEDKESFISRNDILREDGTISLYKAAKKYNVVVVVLPDGNGDDPAEQPLWYGNVKTSGSGKDGYLSKNRTILVNYKAAEDKKDTNLYYTKYSGRYTNFEYKAQGSSAKKYMIAHNVQASKGKWQTLQNIEQAAAGTADKVTSKTVPVPNCSIEAKKMVGKVNTASSMLSHKIGAVKLFNDCWFEGLNGNTYTPGNDKTRIAVYQDAFLYFYALVPDPSKIKTVWDLCNVTVLGNGIQKIEDSKAQFFGFFTWGSGKADKPQFGYGDDTPEFILMEGADNASPGANFNQPWAAFQCWDTTKRFADQTARIQLNSKTTRNDPYAGLLIDDETLRFEQSTDPWDFDYGVEEVTKGSKLYLIPETTKNSMNYFIKFYNAMYEYDYTDLTPYTDTVFNEELAKDATGNVIDTRDTSLRYVIVQGNTKNLSGVSIAKFDVYRYDLVGQKFVPAGLHYDSDNSQWESYNLVSAVRGFCDTELGSKYHNETKAANAALTYNMNYANIATPSDWEDVVANILPAYKDMFEAAIQEYTDFENLAYHQAFMRIVSGTDNRAKNTYLAIFGKRYTNRTVDGSETHAEYKISSADEYNKKVGYFLVDAEGKEDQSKFYLKEAVGNVTYLLGDAELVETAASDKSSEKRTKLTKLIKANYAYQTDEGDYKIRFMQDDTDTIFETDNNGLLLKPYYLLEPAFDTTTANYWGDNHSSLFYPFDISFNALVNSKVETLIKYLVGDYGSLMNSNTKFYQYFFGVQEYYPPIAYNHTAEIYYELPELFYSNGDKGSGYESISGFANNSVPYPLSLSHGSCLESEIQFMTDRLKMLGSMTRTATGLRKNVAISGTDSGGSSYNYNVKMNVKFLDYVSPGLAINLSGGTSYHYMLNHTSNKANDPSYKNHLTYDSLFDNLFLELCSTLNTYAYPGYEYSLITPQLTSNISNNLLDVDKYKEVTILDGLSCTSFFIEFANAAKVVIRDVPNYKIGGTYYTMSTYYPVVEELTLNNITFTSNSVTLDFRNCSRLRSVDLTGCTGIKSIIIPDNKNLEKLVIPASVTVLSLGYLPKLDSENFEGNGFKATSLTIDAGNVKLFHKLLSEHVADTAENLIIYNIKDKDIWIPENLLEVMVGIDYVSFSGTLFVGTSAACIGNNHQYVSDEGEIISWQTKKLLAEKFGNIDATDSTQTVKVKYVSKDITSVKIATGINLSKDGIPDYNLTLNGNNVKITGNTLDINYTIDKLLNLGKASISDANRKTGYVNLNGSPDEAIIDVKIVVNVISGASITAIDAEGKLYCRINIGFREPKIGDFAYADGSFSEFYTSSKTLIGFVYYVVKNEDTSFEVRVMSAEASSERLPLGPASSTIYAYTDSSKKPHRLRLEALMSQLSYDKPSSSESSYIWPSYSIENQKTFTKASGTVVYSDSKPLKPKDNMTSGREITEAYVTWANNFVTRLRGAEVGNFNYSSITEDNYKAIIENLSDRSFGKYASAEDNYSALVYPAYLYAYYYTPKCKSGETLADIYKDTKWYIPSTEELNWVIQNIINGLTISSQNGAEATYWKTYIWVEGGTGFFANMAKQTTNLNNKFAILGNKEKVSGESTGDYPYLYRDRYDYSNAEPKWYNTNYGEQYAKDDENVYKVVPCTIINVKKE